MKIFYKIKITIFSDIAVHAMNGHSKGAIFIPIIIKSTQIQDPHRIDSITSGSSPAIISPQHQLGHRQGLVSLMSVGGLIICFSLQTATLFLWCWCSQSTFDISFFFSTRLSILLLLFLLTSLPFSNSV